MQHAVNGSSICGRPSLTKSLAPISLLSVVDSSQEKANTHLTYSVDSEGDIDNKDEDDVDDMDEDDVDDEDARFYIFECRICSKGFYHKSAYEKHLKSHSDERPVKCEFPSCDKAFKFKKDLKLHTLNHGDDYHCSLWYPGDQNPLKWTHDTYRAA